MHIHTHFRSGVKVKERGTCEKVPVTFTLVFPLIFGDFFAVRASRKKFIVCATNFCCRPGIGLGWAAGQIDRWLFFFGFLFFSIQATGERGRCVDNDNNNVTRVDPSRSLSLVMMVIIIIIITILVNYYYYDVPSSIQKKKKSRPLRVH